MFINLKFGHYIYMKKLIIILITFLISATASFAASNYINELNEYALWKNKKHIKVWVQPCAYKQTVYNAFREWMIAGGGCIKFIETNSPSTADIKVYFVPKFNDNKAGVTEHVSQAGGKYILSATVKIRYTDYYRPQRTLSKDEIYAVAVHEIGHAIGILGHSSNRNDIMYPTTDIIGIHASNRDVNTIRQFYCSGKY